MSLEQSAQLSSSNLNADRSVVHVRDAKFSFGSRKVLEGISLELRAGEIYGLLGPNGAGKTTLMKAMCGRLELDAGEIRIAGEDPYANSSARQAISYVPQDIAIFPYLTVSENLEVFGALAGVPRKLIKQTVKSILDEALLTDRAQQLCQTLSGGYQRRVNICASILSKPLALVLDEPTVGIDIDARESIHGLLHVLRDNGAAILIATHDLDQAQYLCDRVGLMRNGQLVAEGTPGDLILKQFGNDREIVVILGAPAGVTGETFLKSEGFKSTQAPMTWLGRISQEHLDVQSMSSKLNEFGLRVKEIRIRAPDLGSIFMEILSTER